MNFDNCNYVISNADQLIRSLLNQGQQESINSETGQTTTDTLMGREPNTTGGFGGLIETIMMVVGLLLLYTLLNSYINNRKNKLNQKPTQRHQEDNNDRDTSPVM